MPLRWVVWGNTFLGWEAHVRGGSPRTPPRGPRVQNTTEGLLRAALQSLLSPCLPLPVGSPDTLCSFGACHSGAAGVPCHTQSTSDFRCVALGLSQVGPALSPTSPVPSRAFTSAPGSAHPSYHPKPAIAFLRVPLLMPADPWEIFPQTHSDIQILPVYLHHIACLPEVSSGNFSLHFSLVLLLHIAYFFPMISFHLLFCFFQMTPVVVFFDKIL